jgi:D-arabinitol dehydrogenase (NADP+)
MKSPSLGKHSDLHPCLTLTFLTLSRSFSEMWCVGRSVKYLESGKVNVKGIVDQTFPLERFGDALDAVRNKKCIKAAIVFD